MRKLISVVIPAYNEERNIQRVIRDVKKLKKQYQLEIIVVDDGSKDNTAPSSSIAGADTVISYKKNQGKGHAFKKGVIAAKGEYIIQIDADYQFLPAEIPRLVKALEQGYDVALGTRYEKGSKKEEYSVNYVRLFGSYLLSLSTSVVVGEKITDVMAGFKGFKKNVLKNITLDSADFGYEAEIVIKAAKKKYKIVDVPISYKRRMIGASNVNTFRDGFSVLKTIVKTGLSGKLL